MMQSQLLADWRKQDFMKNWKKKAAWAAAAVISLTMVLSSSLSVMAWELKGESTLDNNIKTKNPSSLITTIQTNFHAFGCTGFVVLTPSKTVDSILEITEEQYNAEGRGIIFVANKPYEEQSAAVIQAEADKVKGEVLWYYDILLFKFADGWNQPKYVTSSALKMAIGILESDRSTSYDYAMVSLYDGQATILPDLDDDEYTITFESNQFSTYAMIRYPKGTALSTASAAVQEAVTDEADPIAAREEVLKAALEKAAAGEWDDVPKTGDSGSTVSMILIIMGSGLMGISLFFRKKISKKCFADYT